MPCIYTHHVFGKDVHAGLPKELKTIIEHHKDEFFAGLQGPDFLFFYLPVFKVRTNQIGHWQHKRPFDTFLRHLIPVIHREGTDSGVYAYTMGFICHFMLDSECHSYVIPASKQPGYNHLAIENEFDRHLMRAHGIAPLTYPVWRLVKINKTVTSTVQRAYESFEIPMKKIHESMYSMRFYKWLFTNDKGLRRSLIRGAMKLSMCYDEIEGHMLDLHPKKYAAKTNQSLQYIYDSAIEPTQELIVDFHKTITEGQPLNPRFHTTFNSNEPYIPKSR